MTATVICLADIAFPSAPEVTTGLKTMSYATVAALIVIGVVTLIAAAIFIWAAFIRKPRKRRHSYERWHKPRQEGDAQSGRDHGKQVISRRRRHRHHHRERPRNPTLSETGGLPPIRTQENPPPGP